MPDYSAWLAGLTAGRQQQREMRGREGKRRKGNWEHGLRIHKKLSMLRGAYSDNRGLHPEEEQDQSERGRKSREREGIKRGKRWGKEGKRG